MDEIRQNNNILTIATPTLDDYPRIMEISKDVYAGLDYLVNCGESWIKHEGNSRRNLVLKDGFGNIIGFQSYLMVGSDKKRAISQAMRLDPVVRGKGIGKTFIKLSHDYLRSIDPEIIEVKAVRNFHPDVSMHHHPSMGKLVVSKAFFFYKIESFSNVDVQRSCMFEILSLETFGKLLFKSGNEKARSKILHNSYLCLVWIPYYVSDPEDMKGIRTYESDAVAMIENTYDLENVVILTLPFKSTSYTGVGIDIWAKNEEDFKRLILKSVAFIGNLAEKEKKIVFPISYRLTCEERFMSIVDEFVHKNFGYQRIRLIRPDLKPIYYVYENSV